MDANLLQSIGGKLLNVAPALAGAILSPNPATVMSAFGAIKKALGLADTAQGAEVDAAITGTLEERLKLIVAENDFKVAMRKADNDELFTRLADVQNARSMNVETIKATGKGDWIGASLDAIITIGFFITLFLYMFVQVPAGQESTVGLLVGALIGSFTTIIAFYRGSTKESGRKTDMLANSTPLKPRE